MSTHLAFTLARSNVVDRILIPKFYDPDLSAMFELAESDFDLPELGELLCPGYEGSHLGNWIPREHYDTGEIPFVRTSDLGLWRIRPDYKQGVSESVYNSVKDRQDIQADDILFVAHGTYLVGTVALVTDADSKIVLQDHVFRLRVSAESGVSPQLVLAALSTAFVRRQVRSRQFSADIIDKIGERHLGLRIPIPKRKQIRERIERAVTKAVSHEDRLRQLVRDATGAASRMTRPRASSRLGFAVNRNAIRNRILIPRYYDPDLDTDLHQEIKASGSDWVTLGSLVTDGKLSMETGVEVGKMAYGTGAIPFLRTSDLADWSVKLDQRHGVSQAIYEQFAESADLEPGDILLVRDGTYLVGTSAMVVEADTPALFCGGIFRLRVLEGEESTPYALLGALNLPIVRRQMRARQFTRDVIDTLGHRIREVRIPSLDGEYGRRIAKPVVQFVNEKAALVADVEDCIRFCEPPVPPSAAGRPGWSMR